MWSGTPRHSHVDNIEINHGCLDEYVDAGHGNR